MGWPGPGRRQQAGASRRARARQAPAGRQAGRRQQGSASRGARRARARPAPAGAHPPATQGTPATAARKAHATGAAMHPCTQPCLVPGHPGAHAGLQHPEATGAACHHPCTLAQQRTHLRLQRTITRAHLLSSEPTGASSGPSPVHTRSAANPPAPPAHPRCTPAPPRSPPPPPASH